MNEKFLLNIVCVLMLALFPAFAFGQKSTIKHYYLLMPEQYDNSSYEERDEILGYEGETTIDERNGYISYVTPLSGEVFEVALFKKSDDEIYIVYNEDCDLENNVPTKFYVLYQDPKDGYIDVTRKILPVAVNKKYKYKLPRVGTTIEVTNANGKKMYSLAWKRGKFVKE